MPLQSNSIPFVLFNLDIVLIAYAFMTMYVGPCNFLTEAAE
jgi:hypothetical protein